MKGEKPGAHEPEWDVGQYTYGVPTAGSRWVAWIFKDLLIGAMGPNPLPDEDLMATEPLHEEGEENAG